MKDHIEVFGYFSLTQAQRQQLREINARYVSKLPVVAVDEDWLLIGVVSDDENTFEEARREVMRLNIAGLGVVCLTEETEDTIGVESEFLAREFGIRKIN